MVFEGGEKELKDVKNALYEICSFRQAYLQRYTSSQLKRYEIDKNYVRDLAHRVKDLEIS